MKRILSALLCLVFCLGGMTFAFAAMPVEAEAAEPPTIMRMSYTNNTTTLISIVNGQAICVGTLAGYQGITTKVEITLTLQRKLASSSTWTDYYNHPKQTFNDWRGTASCTRDIVKGYQYRTKAVYTAWSGTKYETFTEYSGAMAY